jgi:hypothetical protein
MRAVQLDDQPLFQANEIDDVVSQRELPAELEVLEGAAAKLSPQKRFRFGGEASKLSRVIPMSSQNRPLTPGPSPARGEGKEKFFASYNIPVCLSRDRVAGTGQPPVRLIML